MRIVCQVIAWLSLLALSTQCRRPTHENQLTIACAASVQYAVEELADAFDAAYELPSQVIVGSSGKLTAQIANGAPFDVFISADADYPMQVFRMGLAVGSPVLYGDGQIVLWRSNQQKPPALSELTNPEIVKIAIANPKLAPYGRAAEDVLKNAGIYDEVKDKLVYGESIAQVNQFITTGVVEVGITSLSTVLGRELSATEDWHLVASHLHEPLPQSLVLLNTGSSPVEAKKFLQFMLSKAGQAIIQKHGYGLEAAQGGQETQLAF